MYECDTKVKIDIDNNTIGRLERIK